MIGQLIIAALLGALLRDLEVWAAAKIFCWRKRRQTQRAFQQERERVLAERQEVMANTSADTLHAYPFVIEPRSDWDAVLTSKEIVCLLRGQDKRRFFACESEEVN